MDGQRWSAGRREIMIGTAGVGLAAFGVGSAAGEPQRGRPGDREESGTVEVIVRFEPAAAAGAAALRRHARATQRLFKRFAAERPEVTVDRQFWAANAALVSVDLDALRREALLGVEGVTAVHPNYAVGSYGVADRTDDATGEAPPAQTETPDVTYPLSEMDVPQAWEVHDTRGEGVDVAVIDTGIDTAGHEELAASLERGGWAEFDERGNRVDSAPNAQTAYPAAGHGTAISGIIAGGTTDGGDRYGVAPGVNLYKAKMVSQPPEGLRLLSVFASIEWAIEQDVDIVSMSLGLPQYNRAFVEPIRNAVESGLLVVNSIGNSGRYTSVSAGNIPGVLSVGAINDDRDPYVDSSGERIDTERYWGEAVGDSWPREYTVPDVTAPGVDVLGPTLNGEFTRGTGTSNAAPCVAGVAALAIAATDAGSDAIREAIVETARHPAAADEFDIDPGHDDRYGRGIVSALAAISRLTASETITGTVTDDSGTPVAGATVASEAGPGTETDAQGEYELTVPPITQPIGATGVGIDTTVASIDPTDTDSRTFRVDRSDELDVELTERMSKRIDPGQAVTATFEVANGDSAAVEVETEGPFDPAALGLAVGGTTTSPGDPVSIDSDRTRLTVEVSVPKSVLIGQFRLSYEFTGGGESVRGTGHRVYAHSEPFVIAPGDPPTLQAPIDLVAPRTTIELTDGRGDAVAEPGDDAGLVIDKPLTLAAADGATPTVEFTSDGADAPAAVLVTANDVTVSGLAVDATGARTGVQVARDNAGPAGLPQPSGVTVRDLTVSGADTAVHAGKAPALRITDNELTAERTAISVGREAEFRGSTTVTGRARTTVRGNSIADVETGIDVNSQVAAVEGNSLSNVGATGIQLGTPRFLSRHWRQDVGPVRSNTIAGATRGVVISGVMTLPIEGNDITDIGETAIAVEGSVLAPIRANQVENADRGIAVVDGAEVTGVNDNEFRNVRVPGEQTETAEQDETDPGEESGTDDGGGETADSANDGDDGDDESTPVGDTGTAGDDDGGSDSDGLGPGLGVGSALAGLGGVGYLLKRRLEGRESR